MALDLRHRNEDVTDVEETRDQERSNDLFLQSATRHQEFEAPLPFLVPRQVPTIHKPIRIAESDSDNDTDCGSLDGGQALRGIATHMAILDKVFMIHQPADY